MSRTAGQLARATTVALVPVLAVGGLAACSSSKSGGSNSTSGGHTANVTITADKGCTPDHTSFDAGGITFAVTNKDATAVTEVEVLDGARIIGEKENLPPGFSGTFSITASAGTYTLYCPGAAVERTTLTVTGTAATNADDTVAQLLNDGTTAYGKYVVEQVGLLLAGVTKLEAALNGTDLEAAQVAYIKARPFYEKIEPVAESFTIGSDSVDADIDARENDVPAAQWKGFHKIEKGLFVAKSLTGLAELGAGLVADVTKLQGLVATLTYQPTELANGAQELLDEVAASKITGEEERYSHIDMLDIFYNVEGSQQAFGQLQSALDKIDKALSDQIANRFDALNTLINTYRDTADPSGFKRYGALTTQDKHKLAAAVKAVQEPLSRVGNKVAG